MDALTIVVVAGVVAAFAIFAGVLAYVERVTRDLHRLRTSVPQLEKSTPVEHRKAA